MEAKGKPGVHHVYSKLIVRLTLSKGTVESTNDTIVKPHSHSLKPCAVICGKGEVIEN